MVTQSEVRGEIEKAKGFKPALDRYVIMTTGKVKKEVHDLLLTINREHRSDKLFTVEVFDWAHIEEFLDEYTDVSDTYEGGVSAATAGRIESKIEKLIEINERDSEPSRRGYNHDGFHAEIDEASNFLHNRDYQIAKLLLQRIKIRRWDKLNELHKFRVLTYLARVEVLAANPEKAAELYLEAKKFQPTDEIAQTHEALGYLILGQREQAFELASKLREHFPRSCRVLGILIQSAPDSIALESLERMVPKDLLCKDEVAIALTQRALNSNDLNKAEKFVRTATSANSRASMPWLLLGQIVLSSRK